MRNTKPDAADARPRAPSPYHAGERAIQERIGVREAVERAGRKVIRDFMPDRHRAFFAELPFLLVGSLDGRGRVWASILTGQPGFISSPDPRTLRVNALPGFGDPLGANLASGAPVGLLGIEFQTRRRNRMNGTLARLDNAGFDVRVDQSFGNCPQYIQARKPWFIANPSGVVAPRPVRAEGAILSAGAAAVAARADTFFIATASPAARMGDSAEGVDVSHRGGKPGFVRVTEEGGHTVLTAPDFAGNSFFNTFGNLALNPRAGFLFVDFVSGDVLSLTGEAEVIWDGPEVAAFAGAERLLRFRVHEGVWIENGIPLRWSAPEPAAQLAATGSWEEAARAIAERPRRDRPLAMETSEADHRMKVALIGATGYVGAKILTEALDRGHETTAIVRNPERLPSHPRLVAKRGDVLDEGGLAALIAGHDAVISSYNPGVPGGDKGVAAIIHAVKQASVKRLLVVGGAGGLEVREGERVVDAPEFPEQFKATARATAEFLNVLCREPELDWAFLSPAAMLTPGERTGKFRLGGDQLVTDANGQSKISLEDYAVAMIDELETPRHRRRRFTVAY